MNWSRSTSCWLIAIATIHSAGCNDDTHAPTDVGGATTAQGVPAEVETGAVLETSQSGCSAEPGGIAAGEILMDMTVRDCAGQDVSLRDFACGAVLTLIDVGTASMPPCVEATDAYATDPEYVALKAEGLRIVQVFREDESGGPATSPWCAGFSLAHSVDFTLLTDPFQETDALGLPMPVNVIVDAAARVLAVWSGELPQAGGKVEQLRWLLDEHVNR